MANMNYDQARWRALAAERAEEERQRAVKIACEAIGVPVLEHWWRNSYRCTYCGEEWEDEWSCQVDDGCPTCDIPHTPLSSEETHNPKCAVMFAETNARHGPCNCTLGETDAEEG